jgi:hypothetical protein
LTKTHSATRARAARTVEPGDGRQEVEQPDNQVAHADRAQGIVITSSRPS